MVFFLLLLRAVDNLPCVNQNTPEIGPKDSCIYSRLYLRLTGPNKSPWAQLLSLNSHVKTGSHLPDPKLVGSWVSLHVWEMLGGAAWRGSLPCQIHLLLVPSPPSGSYSTKVCLGSWTRSLLRILSCIHQRGSENYVKHWEQVVAPLLWELSVELAEEGCVC